MLALRRFDILDDLVPSREKVKVILPDQDVDSARAAGELLTIGAVAERHLLRIDGSLELDFAAVAAAVDLHDNIRNEGDDDMSSIDIDRNLKIHRAFVLLLLPPEEVDWEVIIPTYEATEQNL